MKKYRALYSKTCSAIVILLTVAALASCSRLGNVKFCEKSEVEGKKPSVCGNTFSIGEISIVLENRGSVGEDSIIFKFFDETTGDKLPFHIVTAKADPDSNTVVTNVELYNAGSFRVLAEKQDGTVLGSGELTILDLE